MALWRKKHPKRVPRFLKASFRASLPRASAAKEVLVALATRVVPAGTEARVGIVDPAARADRVATAVITAPVVRVVQAAQAAPVASLPKTRPSLTSPAKTPRRRKVT